MTHRIEHASVLDAETVEAMAELGLAAVVQPSFIGSERAWLADRLGARIGSVYPFRSLLDAGVTLAGSSDAPIETTDALEAMWCAVDRRGVGPAQAITPAEALGLYTTGAAAVRGTTDAGRLAPGARADLVVLSGEPGSAPGPAPGPARGPAPGSGPGPGRSGPVVLATIAGGRVVHDVGVLGADRWS